MTRHEQVIADLCKQRGLRARDFKAAIKANLCVDIDLEGMSDEEIAAIPPLPHGTAHWQEIADDIRIRPDAYAIVGRELHCYEVVDTSGITDAKRELYSALWFALDNFHIPLRLWVCDVYGHCHEHHIANWFFGLSLQKSEPEE